MIVELSTGVEVDVQPVPPFALSNVEALHPLPVTEDDAVYQDARTAREIATREAAWLLAFPDLKVPDGWRFPTTLRHVGLQPRDGDTGRVLDYIEYGLLLNGEDIQRVQAVMYEGALSVAEVEAAAETFRRHRRWETTVADPDF